MTPRILVAGATNQIGAFIVPSLLRQSGSVIALARQPRPPWMPSNPQLDWRRGDMAQASAPIEDVDGVIYMGPLREFPRLWRRLSNVKRVVAFSSTSRLTKADSPDPAERAVAAELAKGEQRVQELAEATGAIWTVLRPTIIYGAGLDRSLTRLAMWLQQSRFMPLAGSGRGLRQPVHAKDLAETALSLMHYGTEAQGCYEVAGGSTISYREMVRRIFESLDIKPHFLPVPMVLAKAALPILKNFKRWRDVNPAMIDRMNQDLVFDYSAAARDFGYQPRRFRPDPETWLRIDKQRDLTFY